MLDKDYNRLMQAPVTRQWCQEVIIDLAGQLHTGNHHSTYAGGSLDFKNCNIHLCKLARRVYEIAEEGAMPVAETTPTPADFQFVTCPKGHTEHIVQTSEPGFTGNTTWRCEECHANFVFKPEAKPFGGLGNTEFKRTLARYVREQAKNRLTYTDSLLILSAAAAIDPDLDKEEFKQMISGLLGDPEFEPELGLQSRGEYIADM